ncbi:MAG: hypothetical protein IKM61_05135 [Eubacteriaceae bacterium]|nr:hypothetical protein [Eubacteriaceae bacterium]
MGKTIYAYFNKDDLTGLLNYLQEKGESVLDSERRQIFNLPSSVENVTEISLHGKDGGYVYFSPCIYQGTRLECGTFFLTDENSSPDSLKLFSRIKKAVQACFSYSRENACYYGPGIYEEWLNKRVCLPVLFDSDSIELKADRVESLLDMLKDTCFGVKANDVRLRDIDKVDLSVQSFVIYTDENRLIKTISRKTWVHYEYGSACIFAYKDDRKGIYTFIIDSRITDDNPELRELFEKIEVCSTEDIC